MASSRATAVTADEVGRSTNGRSSVAIKGGGHGTSQSEGQAVKSTRTENLSQVATVVAGIETVISIQEPNLSQMI